MIIFIISIAFFLPLQIKTFYPPHFVIWNVGQGSWSSYIDQENCHHFDMGGDRFKLQQAISLCGDKINHIYLTHLDYDHINAIAPFTKRVKKACLFFPKKIHIQYLKKMSRCDLPNFIDIIYSGETDRSNNESSIVYLVKNKILITGDSYKKQEKKWHKKVKPPIDILILGHHGSKTSTSKPLLKYLKPKIAVASARYKKYRHPHNLTKRKLTSQGITLLQTEVYGNIHFALTRK